MVCVSPRATLCLSLSVLCLCLIICDAAFWSAKDKKREENGFICMDDNCRTLTIIVYDNGVSEFGRSLTLTKEECGTKMDLGELICPKADRPKNCVLHSRFGSRIDSCSDIKNGDAIFIVPQGRLFIWPTFYVGHIAKITHISLTDTATTKAAVNKIHDVIEIETISMEPKIFKIRNFLTNAESDKLVDNALKATANDYKLKRSSTGNQYNIDTYRTSENAFDTNSELARILKKRVFELLGIFPYEEMMADGLQVLRYNQTTAYRDHLDWIEPTGDSAHNFDSSSSEGTNRFATLLLYLSDVEDGGETVFPYSPALGTVTLPEGYDNEEATTAYLEAKNVTQLFPVNSWERVMIAKCRNPQMLSITPKKAEAVLFYSQLPDGQPDRTSLHGGCPVLTGQKWAANLWVWNGPRDGYWTRNSITGKNERPKSNHNPEETPSSKNIAASFESSDVSGAQLYWGDQFWDTLQQGRGVKVNTFPGHVWNVRLGDEVVVSWVVDEDKPVQRFVLSSEDLPSFA